MLMDRGKVCLSLRFGTGFEDGNLGLVAGHLEANETLAQGMLREAREEIGIDITPADLRLVHIMHHRSDSDRLAVFFKCQIWQGSPRNLEPHKCGGIRWVTLDTLDQVDNIVGYVRSALHYIRDGIPYSEHGGWGCSIPM
ncbi:MAG TPA: NUDIX domain-containing protein [Luteibacter sp.]|jgi:8-oxo-dGTP pyrophosphatase MutT (NUDIX family)